MTTPLERVATRMTLEEYLRTEERSEVKREFHDGEVLAMSGGTYRHARIATNLTRSLGNRLRHGPCEVLGSDMRVGVDETQRYVYPDTSIICGGPQFHPRDRNQTTITNPRVILEVLSDSTGQYDRGEKFRQYMRIPSLEEYILVEQDVPVVQSFLRQPDGTWSLRTWEGIETIAEVRCMKLPLPLTEIYEGLTFDAASPAAPQP